MKTRSLTLTALLILVLLAGAPPASAVAVLLEEPWDDYNPGVYPPIPSAERVPGWTYGTNGPSAPSGCSVGGGLELVSSPAVAGQSLKLESASVPNTATIGCTAQGMTLTLGTVSYPCDGDDAQTFEFDLYLTGYPTGPGSASTDQRYRLLAADGSRWIFEINEDGGGGSTASIETSTGATASAGLSGTAITLNEWWHITMGSFDCENEAFYVTKSKVSDGSGFGVASVDGAALAGTMGTPNQFVTQHNCATSGTGTSCSVAEAYVDTIEVQYEGVVSTPAVGAAATVAAVELTAFQVDPTGVTAIARTGDAGSDAGKMVRVYPAGTLSGSVSKDTNCDGGGVGEFSGFGGVAAMANYVAYFDCDNADDGEVVQVEIRSPSLTSPNKPPVCNNAGGWCVEDIETECGVFAGCIEGDQDTDTYMAIMEEFPIDYSVVEDTPPFESVDIAMAFADDNGNLGVWTYRMINNDADASEVTSVGISTQTPDQICSHRDNNGKTYIYGASTESNVQGFRVTFDASEGLIVPVMTNVFPGTASTAGPRGVDCGEGRFTILNDGQLTVWARDAGTGASTAPLWTKTVPGSVPPKAAVAMSYDGQWVAWVDGTDTAWYVAHAGNGTTVATGTVPAGTFRGMGLHGTGSSLWIATDSNIARYSIFPYTTGEDTVFNPCEVTDTCPEPAPTGGPEPGSFGGGAVTGISAKMAIYLSAATVAGFALVGWAIVGRRRKVT